MHWIVSSRGAWWFKIYIPHPHPTHLSSHFIPFHPPHRRPPFKSSPRLSRSLLHRLPLPRPCFYFFPYLFYFTFFTRKKNEFVSRAMIVLFTLHGATFISDCAPLLAQPRPLSFYDIRFFQLLPPAPSSIINKYTLGIPCKQFAFTPRCLREWGSR